MGEHRVRSRMSLCLKKKKKEKEKNPTHIQNNFLVNEMEDSHPINWKALSKAVAPWVSLQEVSRSGGAEPSLQVGSQHRSNYPGTGPAESTECQRKRSRRVMLRATSVWIEVDMTPINHLVRDEEVQTVRILGKQRLAGFLLESDSIRENVAFHPEVSCQNDSNYTIFKNDLRGVKQFYFIYLCVCGKCLLPLKILTFLIEDWTQGSFFAKTSENTKFNKRLIIFFFFLSLKNRSFFTLFLSLFSGKNKTFASQIHLKGW